MRIKTRLFRAEDGDVRFPESEVSRLVGQRPLFEGKPALIVAASIEDGWVCATFDLPDQETV